MAGHEDLIGRREVDDLEAILSVANTDVDEAVKGRPAALLVVPLAVGETPG